MIFDFTKCTEGNALLILVTLREILLFCLRFMKCQNMALEFFTRLPSFSINYIEYTNLSLRTSISSHSTKLLSNCLRVEFVLRVGWPERVEPMLGRRFGVLRRRSGAGGRTKGVVVAVAGRCLVGGRAVALEGEAQLGGHLRAEGDLLKKMSRKSIQKARHPTKSRHCCYSCCCSSCCSCHYLSIVSFIAEVVSFQCKYRPSVGACERACFRSCRGEKRRKIATQYILEFVFWTWFVELRGKLFWVL